ncbi:MAG: hypothetical protein H6719_33190 [Sandaracinaceae bacterium]|nr:hypothetical protein [Sandaracinaceae bacterium]
MRTRLACSLVALLAIGCSGPEGEDAGTLDGSTVDAGSSDAAASDAGPVDGGASDAGAFDAGPSDAGPSDAGPSDAGSSDAGSMDAGSTDAGATDAGSTDAGGMDAGAMDAATPTTCSLVVMPTRGALSDTFDFTATSNGSTCSAVIDGGAPLSIPCIGMMSFSGSTFGVGMHTVEILVGAGPGGPTMCSASFEVTGGSDAGVVDAGPTTTCTISVAPPTGTEATSFTATWSSSGSACALSVDGFALGTVSCVGTYSGPGSALGVGRHTATLDVTAGPSGPTSCSSGFTVTP